MCSLPSDASVETSVLTACCMMCLLNPLCSLSSDVSLYQFVSDVVRHLCI